MMEQLLFEVQDVLDLVTYKDWAIATWQEGDSVYFQWHFTADDQIQRGREWVITPEMTNSEIVATAFKAAISAEEHECREAFRYKGKKIYGPHFDVDVLAEIAGKRANLSLREKDK